MGAQAPGEVLGVLAGRVPGVAVVRPLLLEAHDDLAAGVTVNTPFGSGVQWPEDWIQRFDIISSKIQLLRVAPFFAYRLGPVRLAAGPSFDFGRLHLKRATNHIIQEGSAAMVLSGNGFGAQGAAFFEIGQYVDIGLGYKSRVAVPMDGDADFNVPGSFAPLYPDQHVTADWMLPDRIALGLGVNLDPVKILLDFNVTLWSVRDTTAFDFESEETEDREQVDSWRDSFAIRGGLEYAPIDEVTARVGLYGDGLPVPPPPEETLAPSSPDSTRVAFTLGATANATGWLSFDAFYEHLEILERSSTSPDAPIATYSGHANIFGLGVRIHGFGATRDEQPKPPPPQPPPGPPPPLKQQPKPPPPPEPPPTAPMTKPPF